MLMKWFKKKEKWTDDKLKSWIDNYVTNVLDNKEKDKDLSVDRIFGDKQDFITNEFLKHGYRLSITVKTHFCGIETKSYDLKFEKISKSENILKEI